MVRVAQCHCGSLRAIVRGEPEWTYLCHCKACQRRTGTVVHFGTYFAKEQVRIEGPSKVYSRIADSGFTIQFHFCPDCGTSVYWITGKRPGKVGIAAGCFADPGFAVPTHSVWEQSRHPWLGLPDDVVCRQSGTNPDGSAMTR
jgi:hypothetical protein